MAQATERRRHQRYSPEKLHGCLHFKTRVDVVNISMIGLAVQSSDRLDVNRKYNVRIHHDQEELGLAAKVVWCHLAETRRVDQGDVIPIYKAGLRFQDTLSETSQEILSFIEHNTILTLEQRIFGRFKFRTTGSVDVDARYDFLVKNLSFSGLCIEAEVLPEPNSIYRMELYVNDSPVVFQGRIIHIESGDARSERRAKVQMGVEFTELSAESLNHLEGFIQQEFPVRNRR